MSDNGHCTVQIKSLYVKTFPISFNPECTWVLFLDPTAPCSLHTVHTCTYACMHL